jgi:flagellar hook protein FlgE
MNLDSREYVPGTQKPVTIPPVITPIAFSPTDPTSYNKSTSVTVFDSLGNSHVLQTYYVRVDPVATPPATAGTIEWNVFATVDDGNPFDAAGALTPAATTPTPIGKLAFDNMGKLTGAIPAYAATDPRALQMIVPVASGAVTPINTTANIKFDYTNSTQFGSDFSVSSMKQDGFTSGKLSKFNTAKDGTIVGSYTNGQTKVLGQVCLLHLPILTVCNRWADNQWAETSESGQPLVGPPNSGGLGALTASATEDSNTDLTGELVNMITAQRVYQANSQTIKTQDRFCKQS